MSYSPEPHPPGPPPMGPPPRPPVVPPPVVLPPYVERYRQRGRTTLIVVFAIIAVLGVLGTLVISITAGAPEGSGLALVYAMVPVPFLIGAYFWLDRYEPEPARYKFAAFVWGAVIAVTAAALVEMSVASWWHVNDNQMATFVAPLVEEPAKCLFLALTFVRAQRVIDGFVDGLVYAGIVGVGFAFVENVVYYAGSYLGMPGTGLDGATGATVSFVVRGVFSPFAHPLFTSAFGISLALTVAIGPKTLKVLVAALGIGVSMALHGAWNGSLSYGGEAGFFVTYLVLALLLIGLGVAAIVARIRQGRTLVRALEETAQRGWVHPDEVPYLARFAYRKQARRFAEARGGQVARKAWRRYQRLAATMAFTYAGVNAGHGKPNAVARVYALRAAMHEIKPFVVLPPAIPRPPVASTMRYPPPGYPPR